MKFSLFPPAKMLLLLLGGWITPVAAKSYYVDSNQGDDLASGESEKLAWKTLDKINAITFQPGDRLLFRSGCRWQGMLQPRGSGVVAGVLRPITMDRYGEGELPLIAAAGKHPQALLLEDIQGWVIRNLAISNQGDAAAPWRYGVKVSATRAGAMKKIRIDGLHVFDVNGDLRKSHEGCGIFFEAGRQAWFEQLQIENCRLERCDRNGICQRGFGAKRSTGVVIRGNDLQDIGGDGIKLWGSDGGLIEKNRVRLARARCADHAAGIWPFASDNTIIQFNQVSDTRGTKDGQAFDSDYQCRGTVIQYNVSYRNQGGFLLVCGPGNSYNENTIVRYNLSVDDGINGARVIQLGGKSTNTMIHNNTFVLSAKQQLPLIKTNEWDRGIPEKTRFCNNLILVAPGGVAAYELRPAKDLVMRNNAFFGEQRTLPPDAGKCAAAPSSLSVAIDESNERWYECYRPKSAQSLPLGEVIAQPGVTDLLGRKITVGKALPIGAMLPP